MLRLKYCLCIVTIRVCNFKLINLAIFFTVGNGDIGEASIESAFLTKQKIVDLVA